MKYIMLLLLLVASSPALAEPDATTTKEIAHLINHLASSDCQFNRNGSWYSASKAVTHLNRKYDYLLKRNLIPNTEAFIQLAASQSSSSGKPYLVKCGDEPEVQSRTWFSEALRTFRANSSSPAQRH
jgi:Family of unknown function (DUF5329)